MTKPVLLAGVVGGVLGAILSFALGRALPAPVKPPPTPPKSEARQFADEVIGKLKDGKHDDFMADLRPAFGQLDNDQFAQFRKGVFDLRAGAAQAYGGSGEFEFCRESTSSPTLVRVTYLEKFPRGCIVWIVGVYHAPDGWRVASFNYQISESGFPALQ